MHRQPHNDYPAYHAHVYFADKTLAQGIALCTQASTLFAVKVGRFHQRPVGPHPNWSCQIAFDTHQFEPLIAWLEAHRDGLTILVHGLTGHDLADHTEHASWLGSPAILNLAMFEKAASASAPSSVES